MPAQPFHSLVAEAENLLTKAEEFVRTSPDVPTILVQMMVACSYIRISGFIEKAHESLIGEYAGKVANPPVAEFMKRAVGGTTNYKGDKILDLWGKFSSAWRTQLENHPEMAAEGKWKAAFDGIYRVRNSQAHGGNQANSIGTLIEYFKSLKAYFAFVKQEFLQTP